MKWVDYREKLGIGFNDDRIVKHNDAVDEKLLEFLLYQTGVLIRMVMSVENA